MAKKPTTWGEKPKKATAPAHLRPKNSLRVRNFMERFLEAMKAGERMWIGVDPDLSASGVALWINKPKAKPYVALLTFQQLYRLFAALSGGANATVVIELAYRGWNGVFGEKATRLSGRPRDVMAMGIGKNMATGQLLEELLVEMKVPYVPIVPTSSKWTPAYCNQITGSALNLTGEQDLVDAIRLVYGR